MYYFLFLSNKDLFLSNKSASIEFLLRQDFQAGVAGMNRDVASI